jgi:inhibitor of Bruton tyrosine kinase
MSHLLWRYLLEDDVDSFRQILAHATFASTAPKTSGGPLGGYSPKIGSPGALATSPKPHPKSRKSSGNVQKSSLAGKGTTALVLTRTDINSRDNFGRTLLHHAVSKQRPESLEFVKALLEIPYIDLYTQDKESAWTALHRALYFGNVAAAQALMQRDVQDATDYTTTASHSHAGGLVKIKDNEGNSPFEVFELTIAPRDIQAGSGSFLGPSGEDGSANSVDLDVDSTEAHNPRVLVKPGVDLQGDEVFAFGSNKNLSLGTGDEDDRHFPERLLLTRPEHLLHHLHDEQLSQRESLRMADDPSSVNDLPTLVRNKAITIQDVIMSKLHSAILTTDPISNLHICGFGPGGRLGTGTEATSFAYSCITGGGLAKRHVSTIALGQDHSIAICSQGEVFTWGSNRYGQLGYMLPEVSKTEVPVQLLPRQLYGLIKKELFIGAAASAIHSVIYTASSIFTFGKNEGQLGLMDADARSLEIQTLPRRIAPSVLQDRIQSVSAIENATSVLLESNEVIVFTHYGWTKVTFQLQGFPNHALSDAMTTRYGTQGNHITKITSGGNTVCSLSSYGQVFTFDIPKVADSLPSSVSTTNPMKARNAVPQPSQVWSIRKAHMSAIDVAVGQGGSIILCTASGSVWRKEKRANIKTVQIKGTPSAKPKDYKFVRAPNLTRAIAVRSNAFGAFSAIRKDSDITREQVLVQPASLWIDLFPLLPFKNYGKLEEDASSLNPQLRFWRPLSKGPSPALIKQAIIRNKDAENDITELCASEALSIRSTYDAWITSNVTDARIPTHTFLLKARSKVIRAALAEFQQNYYYEIPDILSIEYGADGQIQLTFVGADFLTLANLILYLYTDEIIDVWHFTSKTLQSAPRYRAVRIELLRIASHLELRQLEQAARRMIDPEKTLCLDMDAALGDSDLFTNADVIIDLAGGAEQPAHSALLCARCPFFEGLFHGRGGGVWMSTRKGAAHANSDIPRVDLKHVGSKVFSLVLRHIYADIGNELFDDVITPTMDELMDLALEVMFVANELMIDRLAQACQNVLGRFGK